MAASNQASSPSSHPVASSTNAGSGGDDTKSSDAAAAAVAATTTTTTATNNLVIVETADACRQVEQELASPRPIPTYFDIQNSADYQTAKQLLNEGSFEPALETIAAAISSTLELLQEHYDKKERVEDKDSSKEEEEDDDDYRIRLHESLAPLHYLYGTTLLYSIEESAEDMQGMTVGDSHDVAFSNPAGQEDAPEVEDSPNEDDALENSGTVVPNEAAAENGQTEADGAEENAGNMADSSAEDLQIAWENLETARHIMVRLLDQQQQQQQQQPLPQQEQRQNQEEKTASAATRAALELDLAQIHLRLGDLQRINGRYAEAIQDYETSLNLRQQQEGVTDDDRKLADLHYNLALTYMTASADPNQPEDQPLDDATKKEYRSKALHHYACCGKAFAGHVAHLCGSSVELLTTDGTESAAPTGGAKTVGLDQADLDQAAASRTLSVLRTQVEALPLPAGEAEANKVREILDLLREIHEAIDTAEEGEQGVQIVTEMKAQIQEAAEREANADDNGFSTTTIGFSGVATTAQGAAATTTTDTVAATEQQPKVVMLVKKKRKAENVTEIEKLARSE